MHPALIINEILRNIFIYCLHGTHTGMFRGSSRMIALSRLALCCKTWCDLALDFKWEETHGQSLKRLLTLIKNGEVSPGVFLSYSSRITKLDYIFHEIDPVPSEVLAGIPTDCLVPRLQKLKLQLEYWKDSSLPYSLFLSTSLQSLSIEYPRRYMHELDPKIETSRCNVIVNYLQQVKLCAPGLRELALIGTVDTTLSNVLPHFTRLTTLKFSDCRSAESIATVASLPTLRALSIKVSTERVPSEALASAFAQLPGPFFPLLEDLEIISASEIVLLAFEHMSTMTLQKVVVDFAPRPFAVDYRAITSTIAKRASNTLGQLSLVNKAHRRRRKHFRREMLAPLAGTRNLRRFHLECWHHTPSGLAPSDLEDMGMWWPDLTHLHLEFDDEKWSCWPAEALGALARSFPHLVKATVPIEVGGSLEGTDLGGARQDNLRSLNFIAIEYQWYDAVSEEEDVEVFRGIFPGLEEVEFDCKAFFIDDEPDI